MPLLFVLGQVLLLLLACLAPVAFLFKTASIVDLWLLSFFGWMILSTRITEFQGFPHVNRFSICLFLVGAIILLAKFSRESKAIWTLTAMTLVAVVSSVIPVARPLLSSWAEKAAPFSNANNDLALYIVSADNVLLAGFKEAGRVVSYSAGGLANFELAGASQLVATISSLLSTPVWRSTSAAMLLVIVLTSLTLFELARAWTSSTWQATIGATWGMLASSSVLIQQNYFLSQAIARLALIGTLLGTTRVLQRKSSVELASGLILISLCSSASLLAYPAGTVSSFVVIFLFLIVCTAIGRRQFVTSGWRSAGYVTMALILAVVTNLDRSQLIVDNIRWYSRPGITGWSAPTMNPWSLLGFPTRDGNPVAIALCWILFSLLALGLASMFVSIRGRGQIQTLPTFTLILGCLWLGLSWRIGSSTYQTWKFLSTIQPLFVIGLISPIQRGLDIALRFANIRIAVFRKSVEVIALVTIAVLCGTSAQHMFSQITQFPKMSLEKIADDPRVSRPNLVIRLDPYLETMIAPVVLDLRDAIYGSDTYLGPAGPPDERCALSRDGSAFPSISLGYGYFLSPKSACEG